MTPKFTGFMTPPNYAGDWVICPEPYAFMVSSTKKPAWLHRKMAKLFFGWTWVDT